MEKEQVTLKELRENFYKIRKFEIQNLWQRSIFLATFTVILFTGYGFLIEKLISTACEETSSYCAQTTPAKGDLQLLLTHLACSTLAFLGIVFSIIWTMMAKGSKAWYEIYERRICNIEDALAIPEIYRMNPGAPWKLENSLWSRESGPYSVSKINILLGQVLRTIWQIALNLHIAFAFPLYCKSYDITSNFYIELTFPTLFFAQFFLPYGLKKLAKSGSIQKPAIDKREKKTR